MSGAIVTGAASGIGASMAEALVNAGYNVVLFDITSAKKTLSRLLSIRRNCAVMIQGDVRKIEDIRSAIKMAKDRFSPFRCLINSAGIAEGPGYPFEKSNDEVQRIIDINFSALVHFTTEACKSMRETGKGGVIVNLASAAGTIPIPYQPIYAAAKAAVIHFTRCLELLHQSDNIRAIEPELRESLIRSTGGIIQVEEVVHVLMRFVTEEEQHAGVVLKMVPGRLFPFPRPEARRQAARL